jgi:signal transduction histidine kinase
MSISATQGTLDDLTLGRGAQLVELVDRDSLEALAKSAAELVSVGVRVLDAEGGLLADGSLKVDLMDHLSTHVRIRNEIENVVGAVKRVELGPDGQATLECVSGGRYRVVTIEHDARRIGRVVIGPYFTPALADVPTHLLELDPALDLDRARGLLTLVHRVSDAEVSRLAKHITATLDVVMFSGLRALLTGSMHLSSVRESYRELQAKNDKLQSAYDRLRELDRLKSNFLATVSHELRTPLTSIIGYSEMLLEGIAGEISGEQREFVTTIREKGEQLLGLIKGLLDLSKLESGTMSLRKKQMEVGPLIRDVSQTMTPHAKKKGITISVAVEPSLPMLYADSERLGQVLLNLVENAIKFTPKGGEVRLQARLTSLSAAPPGEDGGMVVLAARRSAVELRVMDTGIGIPESERERVFDAFYQVDSSSTREQGGTGLGLSIVRRLVEGHEGTVRVEQNSPQGSVFVVVIPVRRATFGP